jgi:hypothetical protein
MNRHHPLARRFLGAIMLFLLPASVALATPPEPVYQTTIGGYTLSSGRHLAVDQAGHAYAVGAFYPDGVNLAILAVKLAPDGDVLWERTLAGADHDHASGIVLGSEGDLWIAGWTDSTDFPRTDDALQPESGGFRDVFLVRLDAVTGDLAYATLLGGQYTDHGGGLAVAADGTLCLTGATWSTDFPVAGAFQPEKAGYPYDTSDLFVTRLSADGRSILWSSYLGGGGDDGRAEIALAPDGDLVVAGVTDSEDFPGAGGVQPTLAGANDLVVARIPADGSAVTAATYLGGADLEFLGGVAVAASGEVVIAGSTRSPGFPTTAESFMPQFVGEIDGCEVPFGGDHNCPDMVAVKLGAHLATLPFGTFLGGVSTDACRDLALDAQGRPLLAGYTVSPDFPGAEADGAAMLVSQLGAAGEALDYTVAIASGRANAGHGLALGSDGDLYLTGAGPQPAEMLVVRLSRSAITPAPDTIPAAVQLAAVAPNPFNPRTTVSLTVGRAAAVEVAVHDLAGRRRAVLVRGDLDAGTHRLVWDGTDRRGRALPSGTYVIRATSAGSVSRTKAVLVR